MDKKITLNYANAHNVAPKVRTINFWGRVVWDKGPVMQLRLPPFKGDQERILEIMWRRPWVRFSYYNNEAC